MPPSKNHSKPEDTGRKTFSIAFSSDYSTNYTESGLIGAGRTLGAFYSYAGRRIENAVGRVAHKAGFGPHATYLKIQEVFRTEWKNDEDKSVFQHYSFLLYDCMISHGASRTLTMQTLPRTARLHKVCMSTETQVYSG